MGKIEYAVFWLALKRVSVGTPSNCSRLKNRHLTDKTVVEIIVYVQLQAGEKDEWLKSSLRTCRTDGEGKWKEDGGCRKWVPRQGSMQYKWEAYPPAEGRSDHQVQRFTDTKNLQRCQRCRVRFVIIHANILLMYLKRLCQRCQWTFSIILCDAFIAGVTSRARSASSARLLGFHRPLHSHAPSWQGWVFQQRLTSNFSPNWCSLVSRLH